MKSRIAKRYPCLIASLLIICPPLLHAAEQPLHGSVALLNKLAEDRVYGALEEAVRDIASEKEAPPDAPALALVACDLLAERSEDLAGELIGTISMARPDPLADWRGAAMRSYAALILAWPDDEAAKQAMERVGRWYVLGTHSVAKAKLARRTAPPPEHPRELWPLPPSLDELRALIAYVEEQVDGGPKRQVAARRLLTLANDALGDVRAEGGLKAEAVGSFEAALASFELDKFDFWPNKGTIQQKLAEAHHASGRVGEAVEMMRAILRESPGSSAALRASQTLAALREVDPDEPGKDTEKVLLAAAQTQPDVLLAWSKSLRALKEEQRAVDIQTSYVRSLRTIVSQKEAGRAAAAEAAKLADYCIEHINRLKTQLHGELHGVSEELLPLAVFDPYLCIKWARLLENVDLARDAIALREEFARLKPIDYYAPDNLQKARDGLRQAWRYGEGCSDAGETGEQVLGPSCGGARSARHRQGVAGRRSCRGVSAGLRGAPPGEKTTARLVEAEVSCDAALRR